MYVPAIAESESVAVKSKSKTSLPTFCSVSTSPSFAVEPKTGLLPEVLTTSIFLVAMVRLPGKVGVAVPTVRSKPAGSFWVTVVVGLLPASVVTFVPDTTRVPCEVLLNAQVEATVVVAETDSAAAPPLNARAAIAIASGVFFKVLFSNWGFPRSLIELALYE